METEEGKYPMAAMECVSKLIANKSARHFSINNNDPRHPPTRFHGFFLYYRLCAYLSCYQQVARLFLEMKLH